MWMHWGADHSEEADKCPENAWYKTNVRNIQVSGLICKYDEEMLQ